MTLLKTIMVFIATGIIMIICIPLGIMTSLLRFLGLRKPMTIGTYRIAQVWAILVIKISGCRPVVTGQEWIPKKGGVCFVSNHGSIFDIALHLAYIGRPFGFIAKKELAMIPLLNIWILLLDGLFIDRQDIRKAIGTINRGVRHIKAGGAMIIFPEGTRSKGRGLLPFRSGSLKLATKAGVPIIPVAIIGSYDVFEKNFRVQRVPVKVAFGKPIMTEDIPMEKRKTQLADLVHGVIAEALQE
ncbi:MAG: 1-acyl-sn-glycerol-3-phosphate acyltransferase [Treponema sp.]|jgi:1-acyl-sn-glycerol-3-phosphate acyltransferase|nr:1-acyl-sn-glycerol-3-phosphate acyltransferase [Treponema sp.]